MINLDISRTYQDKELFQSTEIKEILKNVLFIWAKENKETAYRQGMNELLAVILFAIYPFYGSWTKKINPETLMKTLVDCKKLNDDNIVNLYNYLFDQDEIQADLFFLFESVMNRGMKDLFIYSSESIGKKSKHVKIKVTIKILTLLINIKRKQIIKKRKKLRKKK